MKKLQLSFIYFYFVHLGFGNVFVFDWFAGYISNVA